MQIIEKYEMAAKLTHISTVFDDVDAWDLEVRVGILSKRNPP